MKGQRPGRDHYNNPKEADCGLVQDGNTEWGRGSGWAFGMFWKVSDDVRKRKLLRTTPKF